jgi:hypothetical protein
MTMQVRLLFLLAVVVLAAGWLGLRMQNAELLLQVGR